MLNLDQHYDNQGPYWLALLGSLSLHLLLISAFVVTPFSLKQSTPIKIKLWDKPVRQLVLEPSNTANHSPTDAQLSSTKDATTSKEQVNRNYPGHPAAPQPTRHEAKTKPDSQEAKSLFLNYAQLQRASQQQQNQLAHDGPRVKNSPTKKTLEDADLYQEKLLKIQPFSTPPETARFVGSGGSMDYLPDIPDGNITLLNTKAEQHAVFVQRVAWQVFSAIRRENWQKISASELRRLADFTTLEAVMNKRGEFLSLQLLSSSGSRQFDEMSLAAINQSFSDQNPPPEACAEDGNIHFIFKSRSWGRMAGGRIGEQRWLLLGTALR